MSAKTKAEELADEILSTGEVYDCHEEAAAELRRLAAEVEALTSRLRMLLGAFQGSSIEWQAEQMRLTKEVLAAIDAALAAKQESKNG